MSFNVFNLLAWGLIAFSAFFLLHAWLGIRATHARGAKLEPEWWRPIALFVGQMGVGVYYVLDGHGVIAGIIWVPAVVLILLSIARRKVPASPKS